MNTETAFTFMAVVSLIALTVIVILAFIQNMDLKKNLIKPGNAFLDYQTQKIRTDVQTERTQTATAYAAANASEQQAYANDQTHQQFVRDRLKDRIKTEELEKELLEKRIVKEKERILLKHITNPFNKHPYILITVILTLLIAILYLLGKNSII